MSKKQAKTSKNGQVKVIKAADREKPDDLDLLIEQADRQYRHAITMMELAKAQRGMLVALKERA